ncbi:MAG: hypothetical protein OEW49_04750 [Nitrosopumilus sp.]|nr:hypothetical protein [Nitrosopumilus sp.]
MAKKEFSKLKEQLDSLKNIPNFAETRALRKRLQRELSKLTRQKIKQKHTSKIISKKELNQKRSSFMKGVWDYVKLILDTYPQLREKHTAKDMFLMYFARRRGEDVSVGDVFWQNPSLPADSSQ